MRRAFRWCSAAAGCGEQVLGERLWGLAVEGGMWPFLVVVGGPGADCGTGMGHVAEHSLVQRLIAHAAVEAFHETVLHRFAWSDVIPFDVALGGKG
mgnify:CR=1 FL=1